MSKYLLKVSGSNQIVNVVDWDGIGSLIAPSGYEFEPFVTESVDFINYFEEYTEETIEKLYGELEGKFTGELTGSITINGKTFQQIINETPFGEMRITDNFNINSVSSSNSFFVSGSTISLPKYNNTSETYELFFDNIIRNDVKNYKITFNKTSNPNEKISYIISDTEIINDDGFEYIKLSINSENGYNVVATQSILNPTTPNNFFYRDEHSSHENYYVDFSLPTDLHVGKFFGESTGSYTGSFEGNFFVGNEKIDEIFKIAPKPCTILKYNESTIYTTPPQIGDGGINPQGGYFVFDKDTSINGDYGNDSWEIVKPTKIRVNLYSIGEDLQQNEYEQKLFKIITEKLAGSTIQLNQILPVEQQAGVSARKKFEVITGTYKERSKRKDIDRSYPVRYFYLNWGEPDFTETDQFSGQEDIDYFFGLDFNSIGQNSARDGFFEFEVKEIQDNQNVTFAPQQDDLFETCIELYERQTEIKMFTEASTYKFPYWADRITIWCIGAGGGGGGGAWGYPHSTTERREGHEVVVGGGGGAGGSVAISSFTYKDIPRGASLTIIPGSSGKGGFGMSKETPHESFDTDKYPYKNDSFTHPIVVQLNSDFERFGWLTNEITQDVFGIAKSSKPKVENIGKKGGDSIVYLGTNTVLVKAQGGSGGNCGFSIYGSYVRENHTNCRVQDRNSPYGVHDIDPAGAIRKRPTYVSLGGGGSIQESIGMFVNSGGHGGYGTTTTPYQNEATNTNGRIDFDFILQKYHGRCINVNNIDLHVAPNIPWNTNGHILSLQSPMGRIFNNIVDFYDSNYLKNFSIGENNFFRKVMSKEKPMFLAPPGGGGGYGVRYMELADDVQEKVISVNIPEANQHETIVYVNNSHTISSPQDTQFLRFPPWTQTIVVNAKEGIFIENGVLNILPCEDTTFLQDILVDYTIANSDTGNPSSGEILLGKPDYNKYMSNLPATTIKINIIDANGINREQEIINALNRSSVKAGKQPPFVLEFLNGDTIYPIATVAFGTTEYDTVNTNKVYRESIKENDYIIIYPVDIKINNSFFTLDNFNQFGNSVKLKLIEASNENKADSSVYDRYLKLNDAKTITLLNANKNTMHV
jgi:hypothetical protein